jgi:hypothetical protein
VNLAEMTERHAAAFRAFGVSMARATEATTRYGRTLQAVILLPYMLTWCGLLGR